MLRSARRRRYHLPVLTLEKQPSPDRGACRTALRLASASPRRSLLLREAGFEHHVSPAPIDDSDLAPGVGTVAGWVAGLAYLKARSAWDTLSAEERAGMAVLGADTVVVKAGRVLGKPRDEAHAGRMIRALARGHHDVLTGVCILAPGAARLIFTDAARVRVGDIPAPTIEAYVASGDWRGKAGAYNLSERLNAGWPIEYDGDPGTIMGLPMRRLTPALQRILRGPSGAAA